MATKKQHTDFNRSVAKYLESIGAETKGKSSFNGEWILKTVSGDLTISLHEPERSEVFSIFCRFDSVNEAISVLDSFSQTNLNRYSGKWNFHSYDADELLVEFKNEIQILLPIMVNP